MVYSPKRDLSILVSLVPGMIKPSGSGRFSRKYVRIQLYFDFLKKKYSYNHEISGWILAPFLLEAVEASLCYFFENWLMKLKCQDLLKPLGTLIHQNPQFYYPLEPFSFNKFNMRHPVCADNLGHKNWQCAFVRYPR